MSCLGNLCYLSIKDNRSKKYLTLYEYADQHLAFTIDSDFIKYINYPNKEKIDFFNQDLATFNEKFNSFIKDREDELIEELSTLIKDNNGF